MDSMTTRLSKPQSADGGVTEEGLSPRKVAILSNSEQLAPRREDYRRRAAFFHSEDLRYLRFLIPPGSRVLEVGCGTGSLLAALEPSFGVGLDISPAMVDQATRTAPGLPFLCW